MNKWITHRNKIYEYVHFVVVVVVFVTGIEIVDQSIEFPFPIVLNFNGKRWPDNICYHWMGIHTIDNDNQQL